MIHIKELKMSLMQKDETFVLDENNKGNYIIKSTATFFPDKYLVGKNMLSTIEPNDYVKFILDSAKMIYDDLIEYKDQAGEIDSIGIWFIFDDNTILENSSDLNILKMIGESNDEITPIIEFVKMTLGINDEIN
jgi:hypothetical protein